MRSRTLALMVAALCAALLSACSTLPGITPPTSAPAVVPPVAAAPEAAATTEATAVVAPAANVDSSSAVTPTVSAQIAPTVAVTDTTTTPAIMTTPVVTETTTVSPTLGSYRDDFAGFAINYPASWSVLDVAQEIKQQSVLYSITFTSWKPEEPGGHGIPEGGSKIDLSVNKGAAATPEAAVEARRQDLAAQGAQITFEEPWDLPSGLSATHWTIQAANGDIAYEVVTAINGNLVLVSGLGDAAVFEQIAMTLRAVEATRSPAASDGAAEPLATGVPDPQANKVQIPMVSTGAAAPESQAAATTTYTVQRGDTLAKIAARFGVTMAALLKANPQIKNPDQIYVGQRLTIPSSGGSQPPAGTTRLNIYLIGEGGGSVGCGDQVVAVQRDVPKTAAPLTAALNLLLAQKSRYYGESGLYNALYQSNLSIASITRVGTAWTIRLTGALTLGGVCDSPRVKAQLEQTALQFSTVKRVAYFINGKPLDTVLSEK